MALFYSSGRKRHRQGHLRRFCNHKNAAPPHVFCCNKKKERGNRGGPSWSPASRRHRGVQESDAEGGSLVNEKGTRKAGRVAQCVGVTRFGRRSKQGGRLLERHLEVQLTSRLAHKLNEEQNKRGGKSETTRSRRQKIARIEPKADKKRGAKGGRSIRENRCTKFSLQPKILENGLDSGQKGKKKKRNAKGNPQWTLGEGRTGQARAWGRVT